MQHARIYNNSRKPNETKDPAESETLIHLTGHGDPTPDFPALSRTSMNAFQTSLIVGSKDPKPIMNRNIGSTITIGSRHQHKPADVESIADTAKDTLDEKPVLEFRDCQVTVWFHELRTSSEDVVLDIQGNTGITFGQVYELQSSTPGKRKKLYFTVCEHNIKRISPDTQPDSAGAPGSASSATSDAEKSRISVSLISNPLQKLLDIPPRSPAQLKRVVDFKKIEADSIEIFIKDVNISRDTMWNFSSSLVGTCGYLQQRLSFLSNRTGVIRYIYKNGKKVFSGYIGENTKVIFRSESAKLTVLIQLSSEMWHFEENGEIMFHKLVNNLFPKIFKKWRASHSHHSITIVLFTSVDLTDIPWTTLAQGERPNNRRDYFRVVVDQVNVLSWDKIMANLRLEFANFKRDIMLKLDNNQYVLEGEPLPAVKGNILEALNLGISLVANRFKNTDLKYCLSHFILVTPGTGIFDVDYDLMLETSKKMVSIDYGLDIISLSQPPLHIVPLLRSINNQGKLVHCVPNWCDISFYKDSNDDYSQWTPRCKIYELQMMGVMENEVDEVRIERMQLSKKKTVVDAMDLYDQEVFSEVKLEFEAEVVEISPEEQDYFTLKDYTLEPLKPAVPKNGQVLSLLFTANASKSVAPQINKSGVSTTNSSAIGTVTNNSTVLSALSSLYFLNKNSDDKPSSAPSLRSSASASNLVTPAVPRVAKSVAKSVHNELFKRKKTSRASSNDSTTKPQDGKRKSKRPSDTIVERSTDRFWTEIENPSQESHFDLITRVSRWSHVFPEKTERKLVKWRSFQAPAALPITTSTFPTTKQLETDYTFQLYSVLLNYENYLELSSRHELMREMIQLRLLAGFQICYSDKVKKVESERKATGNVDCLIKYFPSVKSLGARIYMSFDDEIHRISCDFNGHLSVQLYRKTVPDEETPVLLGPRSSYFPLIRTRYVDDYSPAKFDAINLKLPRFNWNQMDQYLAGYEDAMPENKKDFHMMKFVVMPSEIPQNAYFVTNEKLSNEEIRVEGLRKLIALVEKGKYVNTKRPKPEEKTAAPEIIFYTGNLYDFLNDEAENYDMTGNKPTFMVPENHRFSKSIKLAELAEELQNSNTGVPLVDRTWHFKKHLRSFVGNEFVSWLVDCFEDIETRDDAVDYGQMVMDKGLFKHVESRHRLLDGYYFYEFEEEYVDKVEGEESKHPSNGWFAKMKQHAEARNNSDSDSIHSPTLPVQDNHELRRITSANMIDSEASSVAGSMHKPRKKKFILSRAVKFNVDPLKKSFRPELVTVHYDMVHNTEHCYHIRLQWLNTTTKFIDETVVNWSRLCGRHGLKLVETPWYELCTIPSINPFHSFVDLKLVVNPWTDEEFNDPEIFKNNKFYFHLYLLKNSDFYLDNRATVFFSRDNIDISYSWGKPCFQFIQYIHKTGSYFVELRNNGEFFLAPNNFHITRLNTTLASIPDNDQSIKTYHLDSQRVMLDFRSKCQDEQLIRSIFREAKSLWKDELKARGSHTHM